MTEGQSEGQSGASAGSAAGSSPADSVRTRFRDRAFTTGHVVENARAALGVLDEGFASASLQRTPPLEAMLADLRAALEPDSSGRAGAKSAEAARLILRAIDRELGRQ